VAADSQVTLQVRSTKAGLTLVRRTPTGSAARLCTLDCTLRLAPGTYSLGVISKDAQPLWATDDLALRRDEDLTVRVEKVRSRRGLAAALIAIGVPGGVLLSVGTALSAAFASDGYADAGPEANTKSVIVTGAVIAVASLLGGIALLIGKRQVRFEQTHSLHVPQTNSLAIAPPSAERTEQFAEADPDLQNAIMSCAPNGTQAVQLTVFTDQKSEITEVIAPESWGRGARRCVRAKATGRSLRDFPEGRWLLLIHPSE
jgi:hypothetical protein